MASLSTSQCCRHKSCLRVPHVPDAGDEPVPWPVPGWRQTPSCVLRWGGCSGCRVAAGGDGWHGILMPGGCQSLVLSRSLPLVPNTILVGFFVFFPQLRALDTREKTPREKDARGRARFCFLTQALLTPRMLCPLLALGALALSLAGERGWRGFCVVHASPP